MGEISENLADHRSVENMRSVCMVTVCPKSSGPLRVAPLAWLELREVL